MEEVNTDTVFLISCTGPKNIIWQYLERSKKKVEPSKTIIWRKIKIFGTFNYSGCFYLQTSSKKYQWMMHSNIIENKSQRKAKNTKEVMSQEISKDMDDERTRLKNNLSLKYQW